MNPILRKKLLVLVNLALADKDFAAQEREYIEQICKRNEVDPAIIDAFVTHPEPIEGLGALSYEKSVEYLVDTVELMLVDGKVLPGEIVFCEDIGMRLGFPKTATDELIRQVASGRSISRKTLEQSIRDLPHSMKLS